MHEGLGCATFWIVFDLPGGRFVTGIGFVEERRAVSVGLGMVGFVVLLVASYCGGSLVYDYGAGVTGYPMKAP